MALVGTLIVYVPLTDVVTGPAMVAPAAFFTTTDAPDTDDAYTEPLMLVVPGGGGGESLDELPQPASNTRSPRLRTLHILDLVDNMA